MGFLDKLTSLFWDDPEPVANEPVPDPAADFLERSKRLIAAVLGGQLDTLGCAPGTFPAVGGLNDEQSRGYVLGVVGGSTLHWPQAQKDQGAFGLMKEAFEFVYGEVGLVVMIHTMEQLQRDEPDILAGSARGEDDTVKVQNNEVYFRPVGFLPRDNHDKNLRQSG